MQDYDEILEMREWVNTWTSFVVGLLLGDDVEGRGIHFV